MIANGSHPATRGTCVLKLAPLALIAMAAACSVGRVDTARLVVASPVDRAIVRAVAEDFAHHPDCDYGTGAAGIAVNTTATSLSWLSDDWIRSQIGSAAQGDVSSLIEPLRARNPEAQRVDWGTLSSGLIQTHDLYRYTNSRYTAVASSVRCLVTFMLPAVSEDGDQAVTVLDVAPAPHGAAAVYVLRREGDGWQVTARRFVHFL